MTEQTVTPEATKENDLLTLPEAPVSVNFYGVTKIGWNCQFTLRDFSDEALLKRMGEFVKKLEEYHVTPKPVGQQPSNGSSAPAPAASSLPVAPPTGNPAPVPVAQTATLSFDADLLVGSVSSGQTYWKVKGGKFAKFGVTVWPEDDILRMPALGR